MNSEKNKLLIIIALLSIVMVIGTCSLIQHPTGLSENPTQDSISSLWKNEKEQMQKSYEKQIEKLQSGNDSLKVTLNEKKKILSAYRTKAIKLESQLKQRIVKVDSSQLFADSLMPLANDYFNAQAQNDSTCNQTIRTLEQMTANRDSTIIIYKQSDSNLRQLQREQELRNQLLTTQLNTAYKVQKKKILQNKFLAGGLLFISGFTTTLLVTQTLK